MASFGRLISLENIVQLNCFQWIKYFVHRVYFFSIHGLLKLFKGFHKVISGRLYNNVMAVGREWLSWLVVILIFK